MRNLVYYVATTLDGFIARPDGSFHEFPWDDAFGAHLMSTWPETFPAQFRQDDGPNRRFDTVLMGRATYAVGLREGVTSPYPTLRQYVFSTTLEESPSEEVTLISADAEEHVRALKNEEGMDIWLCGGGRLAADLHASGLIDEFILKVNPILFGRGIPLLDGPSTGEALELRDIQRFDSGHTIQRLRVPR
ncbi:dihydrofolate reductase family protein [Gemmatimonadota bacterium Y43]|uniref:dihydrofolate reductase family protein n=1 Tax=Gaopeijia maritima TaxID=3119007 RepID=UPI0032913E33